MKSNDSGEAQLIIFAVVSRDQDKAKGCLPTITSELQKVKWTTLNVELLNLLLRILWATCFGRLTLLATFSVQKSHFSADAVCGK